MRVIEQSHEILATTPSPLALLELAGRTCYKSESKGDPGAFIRSLVRRGHHSVIEHVNITVRFITDRGVTHELVRHRLAAFSQESTRYCDYGGGHMEVIRPVWAVGAFQNGIYSILEMSEGLDIGFKPDEESSSTPFVARTMPEYDFVKGMLAAELYYKRLRSEHKWSPQQARAVLPNSLKTEIVMTANLREWKHVLQLRTSPAAHPQIRELMIPLQDELAEWLPEVFTPGLPGAPATAI